MFLPILLSLLQLIIHRHRHHRHSMTVLILISWYLTGVLQIIVMTDDLNFIYYLTY